MNIAKIFSIAKYGDIYVKYKIAPSTQGAIYEQSAEWLIKMESGKLKMENC